MNIGVETIITHAVCEEYHADSTPLSCKVDYETPLLQLDLDNTLDHQCDQ